RRLTAEGMVGPGHGVERVGLAELVVYLPLQVESSLAVDEPLLVVAQLDVKPADRVQCLGLSGLVPCGPDQIECLLCLGERLAVSALLIEGPGQVSVSLCLACVVAEFLV